MSDELTDRERLERVEEALALLLIERHGDLGANDTGILRREVRRDLSRLYPAANRRVRERLESRTPVAQFTGLNIEHIKGFVGDAASVVEDGAGLTVVQEGQSTFVRRGEWLAIDPDTGRVTPTTSPIGIGVT